jgi:hypothetical protein
MDRCSQSFTSRDKGSELVFKRLLALKKLKFLFFINRLKMLKGEFSSRPFFI